MIIFKSSLQTKFTQIGEKLHDLFNKGVDCTVYIVDAKSKRTIPQNKYYWGVVLTELAKEMGEMSTKEAHEICKYKFNYKDYRLKNGDMIRVGQTTTDMKKEEFGLYLDKVMSWAQEQFNCYIPSPEELSESDYVLMMERGVI